MITPIAPRPAPSFPGPNQNSCSAYRLRDKLYMRKLDLSLTVRRRKLAARINLRRQAPMCGADHA
jgi:hypothetical protein